MSADGSRALLLLTDAALAAGHMERVVRELRVFFCLPFAHSEDEADQDRSVRLHRGLGETWQSHAWVHRDIIRRFGRFPHRNPPLGRETTPQEREFPDRGGFAG